VQRAVDAPFKCPNGNPFEKCDHVDLKATYTSEKSAALAKLREIDQRLSPAAIAAVKSRLERDMTRADDKLDREEDRARPLRTKVESSTRSINRSADEVAAEAARLKDLAQQIIMAKRSAVSYETQLRDLQQKIKAIVDLAKSPQ
jgi:chromosome segregation ATPase